MRVLAFTSGLLWEAYVKPFKSGIQSMVAVIVLTVFHLQPNPGIRARERDGGREGS